MRHRFLGVVFWLCSCAHNAHAAPRQRSVPAAAVTRAPRLTLRAVPLPAGSGPGFFDYIAYEPGKERILVPSAREVGSLDVFTIATGEFTRIGGFKTSVQERDGKQRTLGPSAVSVSDDRVYIGNRSTHEVCAVDAETLTLVRCLALPLAIDGVAYVAVTRELWVTAPRDQTLLIVDTARPDVLTVKSAIKLSGDPEGYAVDATRGLFYTNLEDKDQTVQIDIRSHAVKAQWSAGCGTEGPRGVALDVPRNFVFVACTDRVRVLDAAHGGALMSELATGAGVDNIDYLQPQHRLLVAAGKAARLSELQVDDAAQLSVWATHATADRARNAVTDAAGNVYIVDPQAMQLLIVSVAKP